MYGASIPFVERWIDSDTELQKPVHCQKRTPNIFSERNATIYDLRGLFCFHTSRGSNTVRYFISWLSFDFVPSSLSPLHNLNNLIIALAGSRKEVSFLLPANHDATHNNNTPARRFRRSTMVVAVTCGRGNNHSTATVSM